MKTRFFIAAGLLGILVCAAPPLRGSGIDAGSMIVHANSVIMDPSSPKTAVEEALIEILDASLLILPKNDSTAECRSRIEGAKKEFDQNTLFSDKAHQSLSLAYRLLMEGKKWRFPEEVSAAYREKAIREQAMKTGQKLIDSALGEMKAGRSGESVRYLLEYALMIITPVEG
jgi:hypothetical protein